MAFWIATAALVGVGLMLIHITTSIALKAKSYPRTKQTDRRFRKPAIKRFRIRQLPILLIIGVVIALVSTSGITLVTNSNPQTFTYLVIGMFGIATIMGLVVQKLYFFDWLMTVFFIGILCEAVASWILFPGWLTVNSLSLLLLVLNIPNLSLLLNRVTFMSGWVISLVYAAAYDALQSYATDNMSTIIQQTLGQVDRSMPPDTLTLPLVLIVPEELTWKAHYLMALGTGDIYTSALLVILAAKTGQRINNRWLYRSALMGFVCGLALASVALEVFQTSQPATIFLFPAIGVAVIIAAWRSKALLSLRLKPLAPPIA